MQHEEIKKLNEIENKEKNNVSNDNILIFCAHPDDEILGVGGAIAKYSQEGKNVISIIYSYGENGNWWLKEEHTKDIRAKESLKAGKIVGTKETFFLGLKDLSLKDEVKREDVKEKILSLIEFYKPKKIFTHSFDDVVYPDHIAVYESVIEAVKKLGIKTEIYVFNIWGKDIRSSKNLKLVVDVTKTFKLKIKALKEFKSQKFLVMWQLTPGVVWRAFVDGLYNKCWFAEKFVRINVEE